MSDTTNDVRNAPDADADGYDVVIVGAGAAGLSAALVLGRARRRVAVVDAGAPRNAPAAHVHGFLSRDGMSPADLLAVGRAEVAGCAVSNWPGAMSSPRSAVFVVPEMVPRDTLLTGRGCERDPNGWVSTDDAGRTSVSGVWAVGKVSDTKALVIIAAGQGAAAAFALDHDLAAEDVERAVDNHRTSTRTPHDAPRPIPQIAIRD